VVSHDLKAPVANLEGLLDILEAGPNIEQEKIISLIEKQVHKIKAFISAILDYSRTGYEKVKQGTVDLNLLMVEIVGNMRRPENFVIEIGNNLPVLLTEEIFVTQIFTNLISNSVKYN